MQTASRCEPSGFHRGQERSRGRTEIRETFLYRRQDNIDPGWESISRIVRVRRTFLSRRERHCTESYYVSDLQTDDARCIAEGIRSHWWIENKLHYTKDVTMREDHACTRHRNAAANLALFRDFAFNILKTRDRSIKYACEIFENYTVRKLLRILERT